MNKFNYLLIFCLFFGLKSFAQTDSTKVVETAVETKVKAKVKSSDIVAESSRVRWTGYKALGEHKGELSVQEGQLKFQDDILVGGEVTIDMTSLTCTDIEDEANNGKLVSHLKSPDFFNAVEHQTASLKIKKVVPYGAFETESNERTGKLYKVVADLTIKGITKEVKFKNKVYHYINRDYVSVQTRITLDRSDFDIQYGSGSFFDNLGDQLIYDEFDLNVTLRVDMATFK